MKVRFTLLLGVFLTLPNVAGSVCTPTVQWSWDGASRSPDSPQPCSTPLVVQLTDDNGDGRIDSNDMPDVVFIHDGVISVLDSRTGSDNFVFSGPNVMWTGLAAGDLDADGIVEPSRPSTAEISISWSGEE